MVVRTFTASHRRTHTKLICGFMPMISRPCSSAIALKYGLKMTLSRPQRCTWMWRTQTLRNWILKIYYSFLSYTFQGLKTCTWKMISYHRLLGSLLLKAIRVVISNFSMCPACKNSEEMETISWNWRRVDYHLKFPSLRRAMLILGRPWTSEDANCFVL